MDEHVDERRHVKRRTRDEQLETKYISWQVIATLSITILLTISSYLYARTQAQIDDLVKTKANIGDIQRIENKLDKIHDFLLNHRSEKKEAQR